MDYSIRNPTPRIISQAPSAGPVQTALNAKSDIEKATELLKQVNQLAPQVKDIISMFKAPSAPAPNDPQGYRSAAPQGPIETPFGINDGPAKKKSFEPMNSQPPYYPPSLPATTPTPPVSNPQVVVRPLPPIEMVEMLIMALQRLEEVLGAERPLKEVKEWTITNKQALVLAIQNQQNQSSPPSSPSESPTSLPKN